MGDITAAQEAFAAGQIGQRLSQASRALQRAVDRVKGTGDGAAGGALHSLSEAAAAVERALIEAEEASSALDAAAQGFVFDPAGLEKTEERLFALRGGGAQAERAGGGAPGATLGDGAGAASA